MSHASGDVFGVLSVTDIATADAGIDTPLRPVMTVPDSLLIPTLLRDIQESRMRMPIVVDRCGNTAGLVTMVVLIEEPVDVHGDKETT